MLAGEIAAAVEHRLRQQHRKSRTVYRREWSIGVGESRVDVAAINGKFTGCEIKSSRDSFARLPGQISRYSSVLDVAVLVVEGEQRAARAERELPQWWGLWLATEASGGVRLRQLREPELNPERVPLAVAQLLWRDEAMDVLVRRGSAVGLKRATRWTLWEALAAQLDLETLSREVRTAIKARPGW